MGDIYPYPRPPGYFGNVHIMDMQLYVGGQQVHSWTRNGPDEEVSHPSSLEVIFDEEYPLSLMVMFDSSHFPPNQNIHVRLTGHDNLNRFYDSDIDDPGNDAPARNKAMLYEHPDPNISPDSVPILGTWIGGVNYETSVVNGGSWTEAQFFSDMQTSNLVHCTTHSNPDLHWSGINEAIWWNDYETNRISQIGSGIPPYNTGSIPVNFMYIVACNIGDTSRFNRVNYPYYMAWGGPWMENQAWMGPKVDTNVVDDAFLSHEIWKYLKLGESARYAWQTFNDWLLANPGKIKVGDDGNGIWRDMVPGDLCLYSGLFDIGSVRITTVYQEDWIAIPGNWYRPI